MHAGNVDELKLLTGRLLANQVRASARNFREAEFKVFSQFGDDGIIQYLVARLEIPQELTSFVEFGVQDYSESNTRFLLLNDNWRGLVMDGDKANIESITARDMYWRHDLTALCRWIDRDNIDGILKESGLAGRIGILSIDIDGNDYWVWQRIEAVQPVIVIAEYNSVFGATDAVTVPYDPAFHRTKAHFSNLYWGASLPALVRLGQSKGYAFVGSNLAGNNAYFVAERYIGRGGIVAMTAQQGYVESRFRESRDERGQLTYVGGAARRRMIAGMPVYDVERDAVVALSAES
ncbi:MAG TPA: hypothetical protein VKY22_19260 [Bradyrhizobium sp.]|nr:hypothetical protein [Bradyrhizobium sp.]